MSKYIAQQQQAKKCNTIFHFEHYSLLFEGVKYEEQIACEIVMS